MSEKKTNLSPEITETMPTVRSLDGNESYPVSEIRRLYVTSLWAPEQLATQLNLDLVWLKNQVATGAWGQLRSDNKEKILNELQERIASRIYTQIEQHLIGQDLRDFSLRKRLEWCQNYIREYGDLFARDPNSKQVLTTILGQPIELRLPDSQREISNKMASTELINGLYKMLRIYVGLDAGEIQKKISLLDISKGNIDHLDLFGPVEDGD